MSQSFLQADQILKRQIIAEATEPENGGWWRKSLMEGGEKISTTQYWELVHSSKNNRGRGHLASLPVIAARWPRVLSHPRVKVSTAALSFVLDTHWLYIRKAPLAPTALH